MRQFNQQFAQITGGTYVDVETQYVPGDTFTILGVPYTGFATTSQIFIVDEVREDYPVDNFGYPQAPIENDDYFFEKGAGWFESTPQHRSPEAVNQSLSVFTGSSPNVQTFLEPFTYGQEYFNKFRNFPYMNLGFRLKYTIDNKKSWQPPVFRVARNAGYEAYYTVGDEKLVLNAKNIDLFINPSQGILYNVWQMSSNYNYPIPNSGYSPTYPSLGQNNWTFIDPQPNKKTFFEFAQTFVKSTINIRDRWYSSDGKTSGYPDLLNIFYKYLLSQQTVGIPNDNFTYQKLIEYVQGIGSYWIRLTQQMIPASTIWNTGVKFENSALQRQKFVYRRQRGCQLIPIENDPCVAIGNLYGSDCLRESADCFVYPWIGQTNGVTSFSQILYSVLNSYLSSNGLQIGDCNTNSLYSQWFVEVKIDNVTLIQNQFFTGYGIGQVPTNIQWKSALVFYLSQLISFGYYFSLNGNTVTVYKLGCAEDTIPSTLQINVGINIDIDCV
jgi:hypothetical protein